MKNKRIVLSSAYLCNTAHLPALRLLQPLPDSQDSAGHARDGIQSDRSREGSGGTVSLKASDVRRKISKAVLYLLAVIYWLATVWIYKSSGWTHGFAGMADVAMTLVFMLIGGLVLAVGGHLDEK